MKFDSYDSCEFDAEMVLTQEEQAFLAELDANSEDVDERLAAVYAEIDELLASEQEEALTEEDEECLAALDAALPAGVEERVAATIIEMNQWLNSQDDEELAAIVNAPIDLLSL